MIPRILMQQGPILEIQLNALETLKYRGLRDKQERENSKKKIKSKVFLREDEPHIDQT